MIDVQPGSAQLSVLSDQAELLSPRLQLWNHEWRKTMAASKHNTTLPHLVD